jgi:hypothetical protein
MSGAFDICGSDAIIVIIVAIVILLVVFLYVKSWNIDPERGVRHFSPFVLFLIALVTVFGIYFFGLYITFAILAILFAGLVAGFMMGMTKLTNIVWQEVEKHTRE